MSGILLKVNPVQKVAKQRKAAKELARMMYASLEEVSQQERRRRLEEIHGIAIKINRRTGKSSKRGSTLANRPVSLPSPRSQQIPARSRVE
jgi:hypothetical protein